MKKQKQLTDEEMHKAIEELADEKGLDYVPLRPPDERMEQIDYDPEQLLEFAIQKMQLGDKAKLTLPVSYPVLTKKNKAYLIKNDRKSPCGNIIKYDRFQANRYHPHACAEFDAFEIAQWASHRIGSEETSES